MSRLLVIGNAGLDISLPVPRLPLPGETLVGGARATAPGGKGLNQAVVAQRTGLVEVGFFAPLGQDDDAAIVEAALRREGFAALDLPRLAVGTDCSVLLVLPDGENSIVTSGACAAALQPADAAHAAASLSAGDWLLLQGNLTAETTLSAAEAARAAGARVMMNPAPLHWDARPMLPLCTVLVANEGEARMLTGLSGQAAAPALRYAGAKTAVVTVGAGGCFVASPSGLRHFAAPDVHAVDTTGAGDTFCGVLAAMLAADRAMRPAIAAAQDAAALTVQRHGAFAALPLASELRQGA